MILIILIICSNKSSSYWFYKNSQILKISAIENTEIDFTNKKTKNNKQLQLNTT